MFRFTLFLFIFTILWMFCDAIEVSTLIGTVRGKYERFGDSGVHKFMGIPYAEPPTGNLRFKPPVPKNVLSSNLEPRMGPMCPQYKNHLGLHNFTDDPDANFNISENCLYMNIYVPSNSSNSLPRNLPVMFYIHAGGWTWGSGSRYDGRWLPLYGNVILVTFNYRLGIFGFLKTEDGKVINNGFKDQIEAFKFVYANIASFGGDRDMITVYGHSAGSVSAVYLQAVPVLRGTMKRVIAMSSVPSPTWSTSQGIDKRNLTKYISKISGCKGAGYLQCLMNMDMEELIEISFRAPYAMRVPTAWMPSPEDNLVESMVGIKQSQYVLDGFKHVDFMADMSSDEGVSLALYSGGVNNIELKANNSFHDIKLLAGMDEVVGNADKILEDFAGPGVKYLPLATVVKFISEFSMWYPLYDIARTHVQNKAEGKKTYVFMSGYVPDDKRGLFYRPDWEKGAVHGDELPLVFGSLLVSNRSSAKDREIAAEFMKYLTNFVKTGDPNKPVPVKVQWSEFSTYAPRKLFIERSGFKNQVFELLLRSVEYWDRAFGMSPTSSSRKGNVDVLLTVLLLVLTNLAIIISTR